MSVSRRSFCQWMGASGLLFGGSLPADASFMETGQAIAAPTGSHLGNLYPFIQKQADRSRFELSFLHDDVRDLKAWQERARTKVRDQLCYAPEQAAFQPDVIRRVDKGDHIQEDFTFATAPDVRVPASLLIPKTLTRPAPGIVVFHDHGGMVLVGPRKSRGGGGRTSYAA